MTTDQFIAKMNKKIEAIEKFDKPLELAVRSVMSLQSKRIFIEGKNSDEGLIGDYVDKEIYVSPDANPTLKKFPLKGKNGDTNFKNGKPHKTGYFPNWLGFKKAVGKNKRISTVDLFLTGTLHRNWANSDVVGKAEADKVNQHNYIVTLSDENQKKVERYGRVFNLSLRERGIFLKTVQLELGKAMR